MDASSPYSTKGVRYAASPPNDLSQAVDPSPIVAITAPPQPDRHVNRTAHVPDEAVVALHAMAAALGHRVVRDDDPVRDEQKCTLCYDKEREVVTWPCGHVVMCTDCLPKLSQRECPNFRHPIHSWKRVYIS